MSVDTQQREAYRIALQSWKSACQAANNVRNRLMNASTEPERMYLMSRQELDMLQREHDMFVRLQSAASQL
ncbi:MAG TPA: hypothetical protein VLE73_01970 [Candidatus Saccharimonadales bacterium]|nr:hypothetical protein [Candidatus Saccharimonadales bacterium]